MGESDCGNGSSEDREKIKEMLQSRRQCEMFESGETKEGKREEARNGKEREDEGKVQRETRTRQNTQSTCIWIQGEREGGLRVFRFVCRFDSI